MPKNYYNEPLRIEPLAGGLNTTRSGKLLRDDQSPKTFNIDFSDDSVASANGSVKWNNQVCPESALLTKIDPAYSPLFAEVGKSVPLRGYVYFPYSREQDIGGDFVFTGSFPGSDLFHTRRGKSFEIKASVKIPETEKLFAPDSRGLAAPAAGAGDASLEAFLGYDEGLDDCTLILQKGGDRTTPISWAIGIVNVGKNFDLLHGEVPTNRVSDYALCFMWYDAAEWANQDRTAMRYDLQVPSAAATGRYSTASLRAVVARKFVEPGKSYHVAVQLKMDTAALSAGSWNRDGIFSISVADEDGTVQVFSGAKKNLLIRHDRLDQRPWAKHANTALMATGTPPVSYPDVTVWDCNDTDAAAVGFVYQDIDFADGEFVSGSVLRASRLVKAGTAATTRVLFNHVGGGATTIAVITWAGPTVDSSTSSGAGSHTVTFTQVDGGPWYLLTMELTYDAAFPTVRFELQPSGATAASTGSVGTAAAQIDLGGIAYAPREDLCPIKGPVDSVAYLTRYGIRYSGRDAVFGGLGYRVLPWNEQGFIPFGCDSAAMEKFGFRMADRSNKNATETYGGGAYTLISNTHSAATSYIKIDTNRSLTQGNTNGLQAPVGPSGVTWSGLGGRTGTGGSPATDFNDQAIRGYHLVPMKNVVLANVGGGRAFIERYFESGVSDYRLELTGGETMGAWASNIEILIQAFRWNQRPLVLQEVWIYSTPNDYSDPRSTFDLSSSIAIDDTLHPALTNLVAYWKLSDAGGGACRESVRGGYAYLAPFALGVGKNGQEGESQVFLSGEGEALVLDLSANPIFEREFRNLIQSGEGAFAIEINAVIPEAYYGVDDATGPTGREYTAKYCPDILAWSVKGADAAGLATKPKPLMVLTHRASWSLATSTVPIRKPMGFHLDYYAASDQESSPLTTAVSGITTGGNWDTDAPWVGKTITIQVGVESTGAEDAYKIYLAATPKQSFKLVSGDPPGAEFAYWTIGTIRKKDLARSVITIGGSWDPAVRGNSEYSCRMIVDKVRVYAGAAPGTLPSSSGAALTSENGKISGANALPQRSLTRADILRPLGPGTATVTLAAGSRSVIPGGRTTFYTTEPERTISSTKEAFLLPTADKHSIETEEALEDSVEEFYWIQSVAGDGSSLTLGTPYNGFSQTNTAAYRFNLIGYTDFDGAVNDIARRALTLGSGSAFKPGTTKTTDLQISGDYFFNPCPVGANWKFRIASPLVSGGISSIIPSWTRGLARPRRNPILGLPSLDETLFAVTRGCVFRMDDRWREDGPTDTLRRSVAILGKPMGDFTSSMAADGVECANYQNVWPFWSSAEYLDLTWVFDAWVKVDRYARYQTILWIGSTATDLQRNPGSTDQTRGLGIWIRLANGRPEIVRTTDKTYDGTNKPRDGRWVATASDQVPLGRWTHVRAYLRFFNNGTIDALADPVICINGRKIAVTLSARENTLPVGQWTSAYSGGGIHPVNYPDSRNKVLVGIARDNLSVPADQVDGAINVLNGPIQTPGRLVGFMHALDGAIADLCVWRAPSSDASVSGEPAFDPFSINYTGLSTRLHLALQEGVGHKVKDTASSLFGSSFTGIPGVIKSHPAVSLWHELGDSDELASWAQYTNRIYLANGGRPVFIEEDRVAPAGILQPTTKPTFTVEKKPLWEPNAFVANNGENDPITGAAVGAADQIDHYANFGNNFVSQTFHEEISWSKSGSSFDVFAFKCYWKPADIVGRIPIYSARSSSAAGGPFIECIDGKIRVGWYDQYLKANQYVESSSQVFLPGFWHYINVRKAFPQQDPYEGNFLNSCHTSGFRRRTEGLSAIAGTFTRGEVITSGGKSAYVIKFFGTTIEYVLFTASADFVATNVITGGTSGATATVNNAPFNLTGDCVRVAPLMKEVADITFTNYPPLHAKTDGVLRNCLSFTTDDVEPPAGCTASGAITYKGQTFTGAASGVINAVNTSPFHGDMVGCLWQWGDASDATIYRVVTVASATQIVCRDFAGNLPNFSGAGYLTKQGAVFTGTNLIRSSTFDSSNAPDEEIYDIELFGSVLARNPTSGLSPHNGRFASFAYVSIATTNYSNTLVFETGGAGAADDILIGTDVFAGSLFTGSTPPGELHVDATATFTAVDTQPYAGAAAASSQPNADLEIALDTVSSVNAQTLRFGYLFPLDIAQGKRRVAVAFYDPTQVQVSNPGPILEIEPIGEERSNPSGSVRLILANIPISPQPGPIQRWIYVSTANGFSAFRTAVIPDNISSSIGLAFTEEELIRGLPLEYDNPAPPDCSVVGVSQGSLFYGALALQGDVALYSKPFSPGSVPFGNTLALVGGRGQEIRAMADLKGRLLVWKKDSLHRIQIRDTKAFEEVVSKNVGCLGPQCVVVLDDRVYWESDRGLYFCTSTSSPVWVGNNVDTIWLGLSDFFVIDAQRERRVSSAINRRRDQFISAFRAAGELTTRRRLSSELDTPASGVVAGADQTPANHRFGSYEDPNVTALGVVDRQTGGVQQLIAGTEEGFVLFMDRQDTRYNLRLEDTELFGPAQVTLGSGSTTSKLVLSASDATLTGLEGMRGATVRWIVSGVETRANVLFSDGASIHLDRPVSAAPPSGTTVTIGAIPWWWETKWLDMAMAEQSKKGHYVDIAMTPQASGTAIFEVLTEFNETTPHQLFRVVGQSGQLSSYEDLDLTKHAERFFVGEVRARFWKFRFRTLTPAHGQRAELLEIVVRSKDTDLH